KNEKKKKTKKAKKGDKPGEPQGPRKRKAKKKETSNAALIAVVVTGLLMLFSVIGGVILFFNRTPKSGGVRYYLPDDAKFAIGVNVGHSQKYPEFYKSLKGFLDAQDFKQIADVIAKAADTDFDSLVDYVVKAESVGTGWSIVYRTKEVFDE